jgi:hypothetical protein
VAVVGEPMSDIRPVSEPTERSLSGCFIGWDECDPQSVVYDARDMPRATAIGRHASEYGYDFAKVECRTSYGRWLTRAEQWEMFGQDRWRDETLDEEIAEGRVELRDGEWRYPDGSIVPDPGEPPDAPPVDWQPREADPAWELCKRDDAGAIKVYVCEVDG